MARRGENIRKRTDNRWEGRYYVLIQGQKKLCSVYGRTYREVKEKLYRAKEKNSLRDTAQGMSEHTNHEDIVFSRIAAEWLSMISISQKHSTYIKYTSVYQKYLYHPLGSEKMVNLTPEYIKVTLSDAGASVSVSMQKSISCVVNSILKYYSEHYHTPLIRMKQETVSAAKKKTDIFSNIEQQKLLRVLYQNMDITKMGIILCLSTGLRLGELCALKWEDIDFRSKVLHVNRTVQRISTEGHCSKTILMEDEPKTICSKREIPLSDDILCLLKRFKHEGNYILGGQGPLEPRTLQNRFKAYQREADINIKHFHVLRHTFATNCVACQIDIKSLSEILGHSNVQITMDRYVHPTIDTKRKYMNEISAIYGQFTGQAL